jgi:biopolymer transport protein ExbB
MLQTLVKGGWIMIPLGVCSLIAVTIVVERCMYFRRISSTERADKVLDLVKTGGTDEALELATVSPMPLLKVLAAGLDHHIAPAMAMEASCIAQIAAMKRGLPALDTIITLSPLLGLLGTIIGMISSFNVMATAGMGQPHAVTGGVAEALIATATGISVAVITLVPYNIFQARIERETDTMEQYATRLEMSLATFASEAHP